MNRSPEIPRKLDAIIVIGENIKKDWGPKEIRERKSHLGPYSEANVLAATILYLKGVADRIIFSTGYTAGKKVPSEAKAMEAYFERITNSILLARHENPHLENLWSNRSYYPITILEEKSLNTSGNARQVVKLLEKVGFKKKDFGNNEFGLLAPSFHIKRVNDRFQEHGINAELFVTEDILEEVLPRITDKFMNSAMVAQELKRENVIRTIESLSLGTSIISLLARVTRK